MSVIQIPYNFTLREYQKNLYNAIPQGFRRGVAVWHRRAGKDKVFMNVLAREAIQRVGTYFYILPYYAGSYRDLGVLRQGWLPYQGSHTAAAAEAD